MRASRLLPPVPSVLSNAAAVLALALPAGAQELHLNELYVSHDGQDDQEFIEVIGTPARPLDGCFLVVVEGDVSSSTGTGIVDAVHDLTGFVVPQDGYFVAGVDAVPTRDLSLGSQNAFENGTATYYLIETTDPAALLALLSQDVDPDGDRVTRLVSLPGAQVHDVVALVDGDPGDEVFDAAAVLGPDGSEVPAGVFRALDFPGDWCPDALDYDDAANLERPRTPGAPNASCLNGNLGTRYCVATANSAGPGAGLSATGSAQVSDDTIRFDVAGLPPLAAGMLFAGGDVVQLPFGDGVRCAGGPVLFFHPLLHGSAAGTAGRALPLATGPAAGQLVAGSTWNFQLWYRDPAAGLSGSNTTDALAILFR